MPRGDVAHPTKSIPAGTDVRFENRPNAFAETKIGTANDAGTHAAFAISSARTHRSRAIKKFSFADRSQFCKCALTVHRAALDRDGCANIVAGRNVAQ
jgi:hypothetical protein